MNSGLGATKSPWLATACFLVTLSAEASPPAFLQSTSRAEIARSGEETLSLSRRTIGGSTVILTFTTYATPNLRMTVTDSQGNRYVQPYQPSVWGDSSQLRTETWLAENIAGGDLDVTIRAPTPVRFRGIYLNEYGGLPANALHLSNTHIARTPGQHMQAGPFNTTFPDTLIFAHGESDGTPLTPASAFNVRAMDQRGAVEQDFTATLPGAYTFEFGVGRPSACFAVVLGFRSDPAYVGPTDAGPRIGPADAGVTLAVDAGPNEVMASDAGRIADGRSNDGGSGVVFPRRYDVGCSCDSAGSAVLAIVALLMLRAVNRRRRRIE